MHKERDPITCETCKTVSCHFVITERKGDVEKNVYKCIFCKKYAFGKERKIKTPAKTTIDPPTVETNEIIMKEEEISENIDPTCEICGNLIDFTKRRKGSKTCNKECEKQLNQKRKDEYHRKRVEKNATKTQKNE